MTRLDCMQRYDDINVRRLQILYLKEQLKMAYSEIAEIVGYAVSTVKTYCNKYREQIAEALDLFFYRRKRTPANVEWECEKGENGLYSAYVCEIYNNDTRLYLKIGYSAQVVDRMKAHATNKKYNSNRVIVKRVYYFDSEEQALSMENLLRKYYKEKNHEIDFIKKDRFTAQIPTSEDFKIFERKADFIRENF